MDPGYGRQLVLLIPGISLSAAAANDLRDGKIPNGLILLLMTTGILYCFSDGYPASLLMPFLAAALFIPAWLIHGLGAGDVKLLAVLSLWTDPESYSRCLIISFFIAAVISLIVLIRHVSHSYHDRKMNYSQDRFTNPCLYSDTGLLFDFCFRFFPQRCALRPEKRLQIHFAFPVFIAFLFHFGGFY